MRLTLTKTAMVLRLGLFLLSLNPGMANSFSEPPVFIYGKVIHVGSGSAYQIFNGNLQISLINDANPGHVVTKSTRLQPIGVSGEFSYRIEVPVKYLPHANELADHLSAGHQQTTFRIENITIDGATATPLDAAQLELLTSFANRAAQHRLDLGVSLEQTDTDGDGLPDWWEAQHGLNRHYALDALEDPDGDGLTSEEEFKLGTDPNEADVRAKVLTPSLMLTAGGISGFYFRVIDQDTASNQITIQFREAVPGLTFRMGNQVVQPLASFPYSKVLAGELTVEADADFTQATIPMALVSGADSVDFDLTARAFSPLQQLGQRPALWLDATGLSGPSVSEWPDRSGHDRDSYQPLGGSRPKASDGAVDFGGNAYLYLDDRGLNFDHYSAFIAFDLSSASNAKEQTLLNTSDLSVQLSRASGQGQSLSIVQSDHTIVGPELDRGDSSQISLVSGAERAFMNVMGRGFYPASPDTNFMPIVFATLGGAQSLTQTTAQQLFGGKVHEVLVYDEPLAPEHRTRNEDYQLSRWHNLVVWDYRAATTPLNIQGASQSPNAINGGWGDDDLKGGRLGDVLRGGPGVDRLTGDQGADHFHFLKDQGPDRITDFSVAEQDVLDLSDIFGDRSGDPADYVNLRTEITRSAGNVPLVSTLVELNYEGTGSGVDQTIVLVGATLGENDLNQLVSQGIIRLGWQAHSDTVRALSFREWLALEYPEGTGGADSSDTDGDNLEAIFEYIYGTDPHALDDRFDTPFAIHTIDGRIEIHVDTIDPLLGVELHLMASDDFAQWTLADDQFDLEIQPLSKQRARRIYRAKLPVATSPSALFYRLSASESSLSREP